MSIKRVGPFPPGVNPPADRPGIYETQQEIIRADGTVELDHARRWWNGSQWSVAVVEEDEMFWPDETSAIEPDAQVSWYGMRRELQSVFLVTLRHDSIEQPSELAAAIAARMWSHDKVSHGSVQCEVAIPRAWLHDEDNKRLLSNEQRSSARAAGGASESSAAGYNEPLFGTLSNAIARAHG